jgi:hypothetical protein
MAGELVVSTINGAGFDGGNVIINPEFTLNQRGAASRTAATGYNFDRWYYDGTRLLQGVEGNNLRAGTYVLSWEGSSTAEFSLNTAAASGQGSESYTAVTNGGTITIASVGSNNLWVRFSSDLTNLTRVKLSPGTEASGFVARPYGAELALCQRYYFRFLANTSNWLGSAGYAGTTTTARVPIQFPVSMRIPPTAVDTTGTASDYRILPDSPILNAVPSLNLANETNGWLSLNVASGLTANRVAVLAAASGVSGAFVGWSAEL